MVFDDTARMLAVSWVLFEGFSKKEAARRLVCNRATVQVRICAYIAPGEWWPDPVLRNRHADSVIYDSHFLQAGNAVILSNPEQLIGEIKDVFTNLSTLPGYRDSYKASIGTLDRILRATGFCYKKLYRMCRERDQERREAFARVMLSIPLRCIVSVDETHKDRGDVRRRGGGTRRVTDSRATGPAKAASGGDNFDTQLGAPDGAKAMHGVAAKLKRVRRRVRQRSCHRREDTIR